MNKAATKTAETIEFPTFDAEKATDQFRAFAEKGVEQSKEAYAKLKTGAESAQKAIESTLETAKALIGAKSLSEIIELQTSFMRKSVETAVEQAKDFQASSTKAVEEVSKPFKDVFEKSVKELKIA